MLSNTAKMVIGNIALFLLLAGGVNWGFFIFGINLVQMLANALNWSWIDNVIYALIGSSAIWLIFRKAQGKLPIK